MNWRLGRDPLLADSSCLFLFYFFGGGGVGGEPGVADGFSIPTRKVLTLKVFIVRIITRTVTQQRSKTSLLVGVTLPSVNPQQAAGFHSPHAKRKCKHEQNDLHNCSSSKCYQVVKTSGTTDATISTNMSSFLVLLHIFFLFFQFFCLL